MIKNITLGQYFPMDSVVHKMDPRIKLILTLAVIVLVFCVHTVWGYAAIVALLMAATVLSKLPVKLLWRGIRPLWFILLFAFVLNLFFLKGEHLLFRWWIFEVFEEGLIKAVIIAVRLVLLLTTTTVMTLTTSPIEITDALERLLSPLKLVRFPVHEMALMMSIALRFIPTLMEETDRIMKAQTARGASFDTGGVIARAKGMIPILVPLFVSAFKRADELAMAMESRCYNGGEGRTRMKVLHIKGADIVACVITAGLITFICFGF